jgi:hypothetical protein
MTEAEWLASEDPAAMLNVPNVDQHRLTAEHVLAIRRRAAAGESFVNIGRDLGFSDSHISAVVKGKV